MLAFFDLFHVGYKGKKKKTSTEQINTMGDHLVNTLSLQLLFLLGKMSIHFLIKTPR